MCTVKMLEKYMRKGRKLKLEYHDTIKTGDVFGKWTVVDNKIIRDKQLKLVVQCECGIVEKVIAHRLTRGTTVGCRRCTRAGSSHYKWGGSGKIPGTVLYTIKQNAKNRSKNGREIEVNLTSEYLAELYEKQNGKCAITGLPIEASITNTKNRGRVWTASVDRIDSSKGYIEGNVQWLHKDINRMKWDLDTDKFIELCKLVANNNG